MNTLQMKIPRIYILFLLLFLIVPSVASAQSVANKAWAPFLKKFTSAVRTKNRVAILVLTIDDSRFERDAGGDSREEMVSGITLSDLRSGFKAWNGGKITRKGCIWFKFIDNRWYFAGTPCD